MSMFSRYRLLLLGFLVPLAAGAHGLGGVSFDREVNGYFMDISTDQPVLRPQTITLIDFQLWQNEPDWEMAPFSAVVVQIKDGENLVFESRIAKHPLGWTGMRFTFPRSGRYTLSVDFQNGQDSIMKQAFTLNVEERGRQWMLLGIATTGVLALGLLWVRRQNVAKRPLPFQRL